MVQFRKQTWTFENVYVLAKGTTVGPLEGKGPLKESFDKSFSDLYCGEASWELAERKLLSEAIDICLEQKHLKSRNIDLLLAGDLLNQNVTSSYVAREKEIPFLGMFSACATAMETVAVGAALISSGFAEKLIAATSSHNATAEKQFRYPTEFGVQKKETATFTVTGAGAVMLGKNKSNIKVTSATIGQIVDLGIKDPLNLGTAMAPAACETIVTHLEDTKQTVDDFDLIVTGDLSRIGSEIVKKLLKEKGIDVANKYHDCGVMVYAPDQGIFAGGSGCACPAVVTFGHLFNEMLSGKIKKMLVVATGALLNPLMIQQKESIPCIAHGVVFETEVG